jgi:hypothetical protein
MKRMLGARHPQESEICVGCGLCCDGTLHGHAKGHRGEDSGFLISIGLTPISAADGKPPSFKLPCPQFDGVCTRYNLQRAHTCSAYRCRLLKSVAEGKHSVEDAKDVVSQTRALRDEIRPVFSSLYADFEAACWLPPAEGLSLHARALNVIVAMMKPECQDLRTKHSRLLLATFQFGARVTREFLPQRKHDGKGPTSAQSSGKPTQS